MKKALSLLIALAMLIGMVPAVFAAEDAAPTYAKITSMDELTSGEYVVVCNNGVALGKLDGSWVTTAAPVVDGDVVTDAAGAVWTLTVDGTNVKLADANGKYIAPKGGNNNGIKEGEYNWSVSCTDGMFKFAGQGSDTVTLAGNADSENKFRGYKNTTVTGSYASKYPSTFALYKLVEEEEIVVENPMYEGDTEFELPLGTTETVTKNFVATETGTLYVVATEFLYMSQYSDEYYDNSDYMEDFTNWTNMTINGEPLSKGFFGTVEVVKGEVYTFSWSLVEGAYYGYKAVMNLSYTDENYPRPGLGVDLLPTDLPMNTVEIPAGGKQLYTLSGEFSGYILCVTGENAYISVEQYDWWTGEINTVIIEAVDGVVSYNLDEYSSHEIYIHNGGEEAAIFEMTCYAPYGGEKNPIIVENLEDIYIESIQDDYSTTFFQWTADKVGTITVLPDGTVDMYFMNLTKDENGFYDDTWTYYNAYVEEGDVLQVMVGGGHFTGDFFFEYTFTEGYREGSVQNPMSVDLLAGLSVEISDETVYYSWTPDFTGTVALNFTYKYSWSSNLATMMIGEEVFNYGVIAKDGETIVSEGAELAVTAGEEIVFSLSAPNSVYGTMVATVLTTEEEPADPVLPEIPEGGEIFAEETVTVPNSYMGTSKTYEMTGEGTLILYITSQPADTSVEYALYVKGTGKTYYHTHNDGATQSIEVAAGDTVKIELCLLSDNGNGGYTGGDVSYTLVFVPSGEVVEPVEPETMTIYFENNWLWPDVKIYWWGSEGENPAWNGYEMTYVDTTAEGFDRYMMEVPTDVDGIIFSGTGEYGFEQSTDITGGWYDGICYYMTYDSETNTKPCGSYTYEPIEEQPEDGVLFDGTVTTTDDTAYWGEIINLVAPGDGTITVSFVYTDVYPEYQVIVFDTPDAWGEWYNVLSGSPDTMTYEVREGNAIQLSVATQKADGTYGGGSVEVLVTFTPGEVGGGEDIDTNLVLGENTIVINSGEAMSPQYTFIPEQDGLLNLELLFLQYTYQDLTEDVTASIADYLGSMNIGLQVDGYDYTEPVTVTAGTPVIITMTQSRMYSMYGYAWEAILNLTITEDQGGGDPVEPGETESLVLGENAINQGITYTFTAEQDGTLIINFISIIWDNSGTTPAYGLGSWVDVQINGQSITQFYNTVNVTAGDVVTVYMINIDASFYTATVNLSYAAAAQPLQLGFNDLETFQEYYYIAEQTGNLYLTITDIYNVSWGQSMEDLDYYVGYQYIKITVNGEPMTGATMEIAVTEGDEVTISVNTSNYTIETEVYLSYEGFYEHPLGSERNPVELAYADCPTTTPEIAAGEAMWYKLDYDFGESVIYVYGENAYVLFKTYDGTEVRLDAVDGVVAYSVSEHYIYDIQIGNAGTEAAVFEIEAYIPEGAFANPDELVEGMNSCDVIAHQTYYWTWTAPADGTLSLTFGDIDWVYYIYRNDTYDSYGSYTQGTVNPAVIEVKAGDVFSIEVRIQTADYDSYASTITIDLAFTAAGAEVLSGDANGDGEINYFDAIMILQYYTEEEAEGIDLTAADINGDGEVNYLDAIAILQFYVENEE